MSVTRLRSGAISGGSLPGDEGVDPHHVVEVAQDRLGGRGDAELSSAGEVGPHRRAGEAMRFTATRMPGQDQHRGGRAHPVLHPPLLSWSSLSWRQLHFRLSIDRTLRKRKKAMTER